MELFRSSFDRKPAGIFSHFGSMAMAANRLESMFSYQAERRFNGSEIEIHTHKGRTTESLEQTLDNFARFLERAVIIRADVDIRRPLRLTDCWGDDPIGSGALDIFAGNTDLSSAQRAELENLFHPFRGVIYPPDVHAAMPDKAIRAIMASGRQNGLFQQEWQKRKQRSLSIGEDFKAASAQEAVWVHLTLKLRTWALEKKYDSFVYLNESETDGQPDDSYVALHAGQAGKTSQCFLFSREKFMETVAPVCKEMLRRRWEDRRLGLASPHLKSCLWGGMDPTLFWQAEGASPRFAPKILP